MKELRIQGLRSLTDTGWVRIAPITVLLGENSSGKSTFLRTFPLLRQSVEIRTSEPFLWFGRLVDFGTFDESVSNFLDKKEVHIGFVIDLDPNAYLIRHALDSHRMQDTLGAAECRVGLSVVAGQRQTSTPGEKRIGSFVSCLRLEIWDTTIELRFSSPADVESLLIDSEDFGAEARASYSATELNSPTPTLYPFGTDIREDEIGPSPLAFEDLLHNHVKSLVHNRTKDASISELTDQIALAPAEHMLRTIKDSQKYEGIWRKQVATWNVDTPDFDKLRKLLWGARLEEVLDSLAQTLRAEFLSISYITPLRAAAERYYRQQGLAVNELDAKGENFAVFLRSLSTTDRESLRGWLSAALGIYVELVESAGHVSLYLVDSKSGSWVNLADTGFGYSQLLPIAVQLWLTQNKTAVPARPKKSRRLPTVVIEQPELHLHPRIQAKVADLLAQVASSSKESSGAYTVVETHSEALVNRLGKLVATGVLSPADVSIILFEKEGFEIPSKVRATSFDANGFLKDWPLGFFNSD